MKLIYRILFRLSLILSVIIAAWAFLFYMVVTDEINDEVDDLLEEYSEELIKRTLSGEELPPEEFGMNNRYRLIEVDQAYAEALARKGEMYYTDREDSERIMTSIFRDKDDRYYVLRVFTPTVENDDLHEAVWRWCVFLYLFSLLTVVIITTWVFYRSMRPLYTLLDWLDNYRIGRKNEPLKNDTTISEFRKLNEATIRNAERNELMFERQKQFIGNASHEIQTPLAICRNRLETLMEDDSLTEGQMEELYKTNKTLEHITKLNKALLLLTKIDNGQFIETSDIALNPLIERYLEDFKEVYVYRHILVKFESDGPVSVNMNESLAASLFSNLIKNAFVHNVEHGEIHISLDRERFEIRNTSEGKPLDKERVFERFYQVGKKKGSTGLGLAIAHSICVSQGLSLSYDYIEGEHVFKIKFGKR